MDLHLSEKQEMLYKMYHDSAGNEVRLLAEWVDENEALPEETTKKMAKLGMMGIYFPKEYGGAGADVLSYVMAVEEMSKVRGTTDVIISAHILLCCVLVYKGGIKEQRKYYLPRLRSGEWVGAFGLTEPGAGTDAQGQQTVVMLDEKRENWILNGSKTFITNAGYANVFMIFAITGITADERGRGKREISAFIVERTDPGFFVGEHEKKMGIKGSSTYELIMEDRIIPKDHLLGKQGKGFGIIMKALDGGRISIAPQTPDLAEKAIEETIKYTKECVQFGRRISQLQNTQFQLADIHAKTEAAKWLVYPAAMKKENREPYTVDAAMVKLVVAETAGDVTRRCVQLFGGYSYTREYPMERMMRDARITEVYEGTSGVQRMIISANLGVDQENWGENYDMKCIVCAKQVLDTSGVMTVREDGTMGHAAMATITNHDDLVVVEAALCTKDATGYKVVVASMSPPPAEGVLCELLAMGCDETVLVSTRELGGFDIYTTSQTLTVAIKKVGVDEGDIVFCGHQTINDDTAQIGPQVAEKLHLPQVSYVAEITVGNKAVTMKHLLEDDYMITKVQMPCPLTCVRKLDDARYVSVGDIMECYNKPLEIYDCETLKDDPLIDVNTIGLRGSPTNVYKSSSLPARGAGMMMEGADKAIIEKLVSTLNDRRII